MSSWLDNLKKDPEATQRAALKRAASLNKKGKKQATYDSKDLTGLAIVHDRKEFDEKEMILTLKDTDVLNVNDEQDNLENIYLVCKEKDDRNEKRRTEKRRYNPYDETDELLAHYDEQDEFSSKKFHIGEDRSSSSSLDYKTNSLGSSGVDISTTLSKEGETDFEPAKFHKKKLRRKKKDKLTTINSLLVEPSLNIRDQDLSSRSVHTSKMQEKEKQERNIQDQSYLVALRKAEKQAHMVNFDLDDERARKQLEKALLSKRDESFSKNNLADKIRMKRSQDANIITKNDNHEKNNENNIPSDKSVVLNATLEFTEGLRIMQKDDDDDIATLFRRKKRKRDINKTRDHMIDEEDTVAGEEENISTEQAKKEIAFLHDELETGEAGEGISWALQLARKRGLLSRKAQKGGRKQDTVVNDDDGLPNTSRQDEFGRDMTVEETFRQMNYKLHGITPGSKKRAKVLRSFKLDQKRKEAVAQVDRSFAKVTALQKKRGEKYIKLASVSNPVIVPNK